MSHRPHRLRIAVKPAPSPPRVPYSTLGTGDLFMHGGYIGIKPAPDVDHVPILAKQHAISSYIPMSDFWSWGYNHSILVEPVEATLTFHKDLFA